VILVDTSALYALADVADRNHARALSLFSRVLRTGAPLTHNYIVVESLALIQRRLGLQPALRFCRDLRHFRVHWVDDSIHREAVKELERIGHRGVSVVDCASFTLMRRLGVDTAFAFDPDFESQGFRLLS
jgi:predicted nucleic acid-binding protein